MIFGSFIVCVCVCVCFFFLVVFVVVVVGGGFGVFFNGFWWLAWRWHGGGYCGCGGGC